MMSKPAMATSRLRRDEHGLAEVATALDVLSDGIALIGADGRLRYLNDTWRTQTTGAALGSGRSGEPSHEMPTSLEQLFDPAAVDLSELNSGLEAVLAGRLAQFELALPYGECWLALTIRSYSVEDWRGAIVQQRDVTAEKRAELLQSTLFRIADLTSTAEDLASFCSELRAIVGGLLPCRARNIYITLYDRPRGLLHFPYHVDEHDPPAQSRPLRRGLTEYVLHSGEPLLASPLTYQALLEAGAVEQVGQPSVDWLGVPLKRGDETFGVLVVQSYTEGVRYSEEHKELLNFVAQHIASALERKQALEAQAQATASARYARRLELVNSISTLLSSRRHLDEVLELSAQELVRLIAVDHSSILLFDEGGASGTILAEYPASGTRGMRLPLVGNPSVEAVLRTRRPVCISRVESDPLTENIRTELAAFGVRSLMLVPLIHQDQVIGTIGLDSLSSVREFTGEEQEIMLTVANSVAAAIANAELYDSLQAAEAGYREMIEGASDMIYTHDLDGRLLTLNRTLEGLTGFDRTELVGQPLSRLIVPGQLARYEQEQERCLETATRSAPFEVDLLRHDGMRLPVEISMRPIYEQGRPVAIQSIARDLTGRLQAEEALRQERHLLRTLIDNLPGYIYVKDVDSRFRLANVATVRLLGAERMEDVVGKSDADFFPAEDAAQYRADEQRIIRSGEALVNHEELVIDQSSGQQRWNLTTKIPLRDGQGRVMALIGLNWDITDRRLAEAERERLQEQIIHMQRTAIAELSTPLLAIAEDVVVMPLVGAIDSHRAQQIQQTLLQGVQDSRARVALIDITGVPVVDTGVANALLQAARAARLLGAQVVLTGVRPEVAQTLVTLGVELRDVLTCGTLQAGMAYALSRRNGGVLRRERA